MTDFKSIYLYYIHNLSLVAEIHPTRNTNGICLTKQHYVLYDFRKQTSLTYFNTNNLVKVRLILKEVCKNVPNI